MRADVRRPSRRDFLGAAAAAVSVALAAPARAQTPGRSATPACGTGAPTPSQTAGPFFKPGSPRRASLLEPGITGTRLTVTGRVLWTDCRPVAGALLDFWQADDRGAYDNTGDRLRGHQVADDAGRYRLETIVPGPYPGRTRHIHVRVQAPDRPPLTTQLYFPGEAKNAADGIFDRALVVTMRDADGGKVAGFDFVLARA